MAHDTSLKGPDLAAGIDLAALKDQVPLLGHAHGEAVMLVRQGTNVHALGATCSHWSGPLAEGLVVGDSIRCPWHHACFDLRTGEALRAPALNAIPCYEVMNDGSRVRVGAKLSRAIPRQPVNNPVNVVIVGAGAAGMAAAEKLRALGYRGAITLVGNEASSPVDRPNLSKDFLAGNAPMEWITLRDEEFYRRHDIEFLRDEVTELDTRRKSVTLKSGSRITFDRLLLATGAEPSRLPIEGASLPHVMTLRSLDDAQAIISAAQKARRAVIVGSSFIGLEVAASLRARKLEVEVVSRDRVPLERVLGARVGRFVQGLHEDKGVRFHLGVSPRAIRQKTVELDDGRSLEADLVVMGVGVKPRVDLAKRAGLSVDDGVVVDAHLRSSAADVWAAGDIARYPEARLGRNVRIEHWVVAERHGQCVAADMLGVGGPFRDAPFFWSTHYDTTLTYLGHAGGDAEVAIVGNLEGRDAHITYRLDGKLAAVISVNRDQRNLEIEAAMERGDMAAVEKLLE